MRSIMFKRALPVVCLFVLSPLIAEYLSGSLPVSLLTILPLMAAMYGSGALLIREAAVRTGGGWPMIVLLAAAYGFVEEGWVDQSLFNPNYQNLRLLDFGYVAALGTGLPWLIYVIAIHVVWSIATPIALTNGLFPARRHEPWLRWWGIALFALLYLAANAAVASYSYGSSHFMATPGELAWTGAVVIALVISAALVSRRRTEPPDRDAPGPPWLFLLGFLPGMALVLLMFFGRSALHASWQSAVAGLTLLGAGAIAAFVAFENRRWSQRQHFALSAGLLAVYVVSGFLTSGALHDRADLPGHVAIVGVCLLLLTVAWRREWRNGGAEPVGGYQGISLPS
jgi:hypothetical protein